MARGAALENEARRLLAPARRAAVPLGLLLAAAPLAVTALEWAADRLLGAPPLWLAGAIAPSGAAFAAAAGAAALWGLAVAPLSFGVTRWCLCLRERAGASALWFFGAPRRYARSVGLAALLALRGAAAAAAAAALPAGLWMLSRSLGQGEETTLLRDGLRLCAAALAALLGALCILAWQRYALAAAALGASDSCTAREALRRSARAMRGCEGELLWLRLSLWRIPLSCLLILPIPRAILLRRMILALYARERLANL